MQDTTFVTEGNKWLDRNRALINSPEYNDEIMNYIERNSAKIAPQNILEIGCSNGWRLGRLTKLFPKVQCHGIEPAAAAVAEANQNFPSCHVQTGFSHQLPFADKSFDVVIIAAVFMWLDRNRLLQTVAEIDRVLTDLGYLFIYDFGSKFVYKTNYRHLPDQNVFSYKQSYEDMFTASNLYSTIFATEYEEHPLDHVDNKNMFRMSVLQKRGELNYPLL